MNSPKKPNKENTLAFDRDANKMQARASNSKPLGYKNKADQQNSERRRSPASKAAAAIENTQEDEKQWSPITASRANKGIEGRT